jgi:hypothetical protein
MRKLYEVKFWRRKPAVPATTVDWNENVNTSMNKITVLTRFNQELLNTTLNKLHKNSLSSASSSDSRMRALLPPSVKSPKHSAYVIQPRNYYSVIHIMQWAVHGLVCAWIQAKWLDCECPLLSYLWWLHVRFVVEKGILEQASLRVSWVLRC